MTEIKPLRIIDKDKAIEALRSYGEGIADVNIDRWTMLTAAMIINLMPTVDAVEKDERSEE